MNKKNKFKAYLRKENRIEQVVTIEFDERFPGGDCKTNWGCDNCGACYDNDIPIKDARTFLIEEK